MVASATDRAPLVSPSMDVGAVAVELGSERCTYFQGLDSEAIGLELLKRVPGGAIHSNVPW